MGIAERREREREEIRKKILDAARELFATLGYEHVTMRRIAEAIEYSPTTIYLHFKDKDELVQNLCQADFTRLLTELSRGPAPKDPIERIRQLGRGYTQFGVTYPNHYRFMFMTPYRPERESNSPGESAFTLLRDTVAEAVAGRRLRAGDVNAMAQMLWASLHGVVSLLITYGPDKFPCAPAAADLAEQVIDNGLRGLQPVSAKRRAAPKKKARR